MPSYGSHIDECRVRGPTSVSHIMHSSTNFSRAHLARHNERYQTYAETNPRGRDAIIRVRDHVLPDPTGASEAAPPLVGSGGPSLQPKELKPQLIDRLLRFYFDVQASIFPVVTKDVFVSSSPVIPELIYTMCGISAMSHLSDAPPGTLDEIRSNLAVIHSHQDAADGGSLQQVQALVIFSMALELDHRGISRSNWNRLGLAIRKAQDLGLHRETYSEDESRAELCRQIWGGLIVADRWLAAIHGLPMMIDLSDCDRLFPQDQVFRALMQISILLGKVMKLLYTPAGITRVTNPKAESMAEEIDSWAASLPPRLRMDVECAPGLKRAPTAGLLELLVVAVKFLFVRPFMRASYTTDVLSYSIPVDYFRDIFIRSSRSIDWSVRNLVVFEAWQFGYYALFLSAFIQYHAYGRSQMPKYLRGLKTCVDIFEQTAVSGCHARAKLADITKLLYTAACHHKGNEVNDAINPIFGVTQRSEDGRASPRSTSSRGQLGATHRQPATPGPGEQQVDTVLQPAFDVAEASSDDTPDTNTASGADGSTAAKPRGTLPTAASHGHGALNINPLIQEHLRPEHFFEPSMAIFGDILMDEEWDGSDAWSALYSAAASEEVPDDG